VTLSGALLAYAAPAAAITMLPGPDTAMVLTTAVKEGRRAATRAAWGVGSGLMVWGTAAAAGLAAALRSSAALYEIFRIVCVGYLLVLAVQALRASRHGQRELGPPTAARPRRWATPAIGWGYRRALLTCVLNPKLGVFFVVFLPQFIPAGASVGLTALALAALQAGEAVLWYLFIGNLALRFQKLLARPKVQAWLDRITALVFVGFGLRLANEARR
jgi:threonine/homoserine/homoserine lactone efflux protein